MEAPTTLGNTLTFGLAREMSPEYNNGGFGGALRHDLPQSDGVDIGTESCGLRQSSDASQNAIFINQFPSPRGRGAAAGACEANHLSFVPELLLEASELHLQGSIGTHQTPP